VHRILLLTPDEERETAAAAFRAAAPAAEVVHVPTLAALAAAGRTPRDRLVAVATPVIVPPDVLGALPGPAYNLHPGPPARPGLFPACFALYHGDATFGATLHEMAAEVDSGAIVGVLEADIPPGIDRFGLETMSRALMYDLLGRMAPALLAHDGPLPPLGVPWGGPSATRRDFAALCDLPDDVDAAEFARRLRAVGEGPHHALRFRRFGRWFALAPGTGGDAQVYRGGRPVG
jgi:methionyl-tRNA formyltransferase